MKQTIRMFAAALCGGLLLCTSCGGSGATDVKDNPYLGKVPGIYVNKAQAYNRLVADLKEAGTDMDKRTSLQEEYKAFEAECAQAAAEEGKKIIGRDIPFASGEINPDFSVKTVRVADFQQLGDGGSIILCITVEAKRDIVLREANWKCKPGEYGLKDARLYYALIKSDDHLIELGQVNPFSAKPAIGKLEAAYADGETVKAGSLCQPDGSPFNLNCHSADFTDFAKVVFLTEKDYKAMRMQAYGF